MHNTPALISQCLGNAPGKQERACHVDVQALPKGIGTEGLRPGNGKQSGRINRAVQSAELPTGELNNSGDGGFIAHVGHLWKRPGDVLAQTFQRSLVSI